MEHLMCPLMLPSCITIECVSLEAMTASRLRLSWIEQHTATKIGWWTVLSPSGRILKWSVTCQNFHITRLCPQLTYQLTITQNQNCNLWNLWWNRASNSNKKDGLGLQFNSVNCVMCAIQSQMSPTSLTFLNKYLLLSGMDTRTDKAWDKQVNISSCTYWQIKNQMLSRLRVYSSGGQTVDRDLPVDHGQLFGRSRPLFLNCLFKP
jgi:hypothetical protein